MSLEATAKAKPSPPNKMPRESVKLLFAGDLILAKCESPEHRGPFGRFEMIFEVFANLEKGDRLLKYRLFNALIFSSYARKELDKTLKRSLFDVKNKLFLMIANDREMRKKLDFHYLVSKNFRVTEYCPSCQTSNTESNLEKSQWKFCKQCRIDRNYYNLVAMTHKSPAANFSLFLSNDHAHELGTISFKSRKDLGSMKEEAVVKNFHYNAQNLDAIQLESARKMFDKICS